MPELLTDEDVGLQPTLSDADVGLSSPLLSDSDVGLDENELVAGQPFIPPQPIATDAGLTPDETRQYRNPIAGIGKGLGTLGKVGVATSADVGAPLFRELTDTLYPEQATPGPMPQPLENLRALQAGETKLPAEDLRPLPTGLQMVGRGAQGLIETAPRLAATAGLQAVGVPAPVAAGAAFGATEQGFDPEQAAIAALLPFVGKYSGQMVEALATKAGITKEAALAIFNKLGGATGAATVLKGVDEYHLKDVPPEQKDQARIDSWANIAAMSVLGAMGHREPTGNAPGRAGTPEGVTEPPSSPERPSSPATEAPSPTIEVTPDVAADLIATLTKGQIVKPETTPETAPAPPRSTAEPKVETPPTREPLSEVQEPVSEVAQPETEVKPVVSTLTPEEQADVDRELQASQETPIPAESQTEVVNRLQPSEQTSQETSAQETVPGLARARARLESLVQRGQGQSVGAMRARATIKKLERRQARIAVGKGTGGTPEGKNPFFVRPRSDGITDVLDDIQELGGIRPAEGSGGENDAFKETMVGTARMLVKKTATHTPDTIIGELHALQEGTAHQHIQTVDDLYDAITRANRERAQLAQTGGGHEAQTARFWSAVLDPTKKAGLQRINVQDLRVGDKFRIRGPGISHEELTVTHVDPDTYDIQVKDGPKLGVQDIPDGTQLWVQRGSAPEHVRTEAPSELREEPPLFGKPESVEEQKARLALEAKRKKEAAQREEIARLQAKPLTGKQGDIGQGDLLGGGDLFSLREEGPRPWGGVSDDVLKRSLENMRKGEQNEQTSKIAAELEAELKHRDLPVAPKTPDETMGETLDRHAYQFYGKAYDRLEPWQQKEIDSAVTNQTIPRRQQPGTATRREPENRGSEQTTPAAEPAASPVRSASAEVPVSELGPVVEVLDAAIDYAEKELAKAPSLEETQWQVHADAIEGPRAQGAYWGQYHETLIRARDAIRANDQVALDRLVDDVDREQRYEKNLNAGVRRQLMRGGTSEGVMASRRVDGMSDALATVQAELNKPRETIQGELIKSRPTLRPAEPWTKSHDAPTYDQLKDWEKQVAAAKSRGEVPPAAPRGKGIAASAREALKEGRGGEAGFVRIPSKQEFLDAIGELPDQLKMAWRKVEQQRTRVVDWMSRNYNRDIVAKSKDAADNRAKLLGNQAGNLVLHELNRAFGKPVEERNQLREFALTFVAEADGQRPELGRMRYALESANAEGVNRIWKRRALKAIDFADENWDRLQPVAQLYKRITDAQRAYERSKGMAQTQIRGGYVFHAADVDESFGFLRGGAANQGGGAPAPFNHIRDYPTYADAIANGVSPLSLNAVDLLNKRISLGQRLTGYGDWIDALRTVTDPRTVGPDGNPAPIITDLNERQRADGSTDITAPPGYSRYEFGGRDIALHNGYAGLMGDLTNPSWMQGTEFRKSIMNAMGVAKHGMLLFDTFHMGRLAFWNAVTRLGFPRYGRGFTLLDNTLPELQNMVARGEIPETWGRQLVQDKQDLTRLLNEGLNVGNVGDNLYTDWVQKLNIPGTNFGFGGFNQWLFGKYQRGAMAEVALIELRRQERMFPNDTPEQLARRVAKDVNTRFGNLQSQSWIKSRTGQDLARIIFLAPQWNESLIRAEMGAVRQVARAPIDSYRAGRPVMGALARGIGLAMLGTFAANQLINFATRGKPTWENEEEGFGSKISAWIPDVSGGPGFFLNPASIPAEITNLLMRAADRHNGDMLAAVRDFTAGRFSNVMKGLYTAFTGETPMGVKTKGGWDRAKQAATEALPLPISGSAAYRLGKQVATGEHQEKFQGQFQKQVMQSFGVKTEQAPDSGKRIYDLAKRFESTKGITEPPSKDIPFYADLTAAIRRGNMTDANEALDKVLTIAKGSGEPHTLDDVRDYYSEWVHRPFTRNAQLEREFVSTLTPAQKQVRLKALQDRADVAKKVGELLTQRANAVPAQ